MKWVFMQPSAQFKLEQSSSTDGISNQSTTQARRGCTALMNLEGWRRYSGKRRQQRQSPPAVAHFYHRFFHLSLSLSPLFENIAETKDHKTQYSYSRSSESSAELNSKTGGSYFQRGLFFFFCGMFSATSFSGRKGN